MLKEHCSKCHIICKDKDGESVYDLYITYGRSIMQQKNLTIIKDRVFFINGTAKFEDIRKINDRLELIK